MSRKWPVQDAKARFSELLDTAIAEGPQIVTRRGAETAVLVPIEHWRKLETYDEAGPEGTAPEPGGANR